MPSGIPFCPLQGYANYRNLHVKGTNSTRYVPILGKKFEIGKNMFNAGLLINLVEYKVIAVRWV